MATMLCSPPEDTAALESALLELLMQEHASASVAAAAIAHYIAQGLVEIACTGILLAVQRFGAGFKSLGPCLLAMQVLHLRPRRSWPSVHHLRKCFHAAKRSVDFLHFLLQSFQLYPSSDSIRFTCPVQHLERHAIFCLQLGRPRNEDALCTILHASTLQEALSHDPNVQHTLSVRLLSLTRELIQTNEDDSQARVDQLLRACLQIAPESMLPSVHHQHAVSELRRGNLIQALETTNKAVECLERSKAADSRDPQPAAVCDQPHEHQGASSKKPGDDQPMQGQDSGQVGQEKREELEHNSAAQHNPQSAKWQVPIERQMLACKTLQLKILMEVRG
jgi:hypothetical protein